MEIAQATTTGDIAVVRELFEEYAASLNLSLCFQNFSAELAALPGAYAPPGGRLLLARVDSVPAGCAALRPKGDRICEMKRLYVRPAHQGQGFGRRLAEMMISAARASGYDAMVLDTWPTMQSAIKLYASLGFVRCDAYYDSPVPGTVFMSLQLRAPDPDVVDSF
jgi:putative acetyltransferase